MAGLPELTDVLDTVDGGRRTGRARFLDSAANLRRDPLRMTRVSTDGFAWVTLAGTTFELLSTPGPPLRYAVVALVVLIGLQWRLPAWNRGQLPSLVAAAALAGGCLAMPTPAVMVGLLFGVVMRRAVRPEPRSLRRDIALPASGYVFGVLAYLVERLGQWQGAAEYDPLAASVFPLIGVVIGAAALHSAVLALAAADRARRAEAESYARVQALLQASSVGLVLVDESGRIELANELGRRMFSLDGAGRSIVPCPHGPDITLCGAGCPSALVPVTTAGTVEIPHRSPDGMPATLAVRATVVARTDDGAKVLLTVSDVSDRKLVEVSLRERAERDALTGVAARAHFLDQLDAALATADGPVAVLILDLDDFKQVNDTCGHQAGDALLVAAAGRLRAAVGPLGVIGRLGGDEFAVLAPVVDTEEAERLAERVLAALREPQPSLQPRSSVRASIGVAVTAADRSSTQVLLTEADAAMYAAKQAGGDRYRVYRDTMRAHQLARVRLHGELLAALDNDEFTVYYQPIVDLVSGDIAGVEALVRWEHPERGLLLPAEFMPYADESELVIPIGSLVLRRACEQAARRPGRGAIGLSVNLSTRQLADPALPDHVSAVLTETGLAPARLTVEVPESAFTLDHIGLALERLSAIGVRVALDDYGSGHSSLGLLQRHSFDLIKLDRSITTALGESEPATAVVRCVLDLAGALGADVVCQGVETARQARLIREHDCRYGQGYYFGRPGLA